MPPEKVRIGHHLRAPRIAKCNFFSFFNSGNCRVLAFPSYFLIADKCLEGHTILIVQHVPDMGLCELLCYNQPNCVSVNYEIQRERRCELNNSTHRAHDEDFKEREGCLYHGAIVSFLSFLFSSSFSFIIIIFKAIIIPLSTSSSSSRWSPSSSLGSLSHDDDDVAKTSLKEWIHAVSKSIVLIPGPSICHLMLVSFSGVEL